MSRNLPEPRLGSIWLTKRAGQPPSGQNPLSREQIVTAAVRLLDKEGLGALTMRRLATEVGVAAMSLYWHVPTKDAVLEFALDEALGELDLRPVADGDWGEQVEHISNGLWQAIRKHPWAGQLAGSYALVGPNSLAMHERLIVLVEEGGFSAPDAYRAVGTLVNFVLGFAADEVKWILKMRETNLQPDDIKEIWLHPVLDLVSDDYPRMRANVEAGQSRAWDDHFEFGLSCMIAGMRVKALKSG